MVKALINKGQQCDINNGHGWLYWDFLIVKIQLQGPETLGRQNGNTYGICIDCRAHYNYCIDSGILFLKDVVWIFDRNDHKDEETVLAYLRRGILLFFVGKEYCNHPF